MSISQDALQKLVRKIETQAIEAQQKITVARTQLAGKQRDLRLAQLTRNEISSLPPQTGVYEGVGKMFVAIPASSLDEKLDKQMKTLDKDIEELGKNLHYLEITAKNSQDNINKILQGGGRDA